MKLKVFTAFSGYDSQLLSLQRLKNDYQDFDFECVGWSEIDKYAIKAHNALFPELSNQNYGDITSIDWNDVPDFDLLTWSFPCQQLSAVGKHEGIKEGSGTSSSLCWDCIKGIEIKRPKYLLMENVKALSHKRFMPDFIKIQMKLESFGYTNFWAILNSKDHGIPQNRERIFMISIIDEGDYLFPDSYKLTKRLKDIMEDNVPEEYYLNEKQIKRIIEHCDRKVSEGCGFKTNFVTPDDISGTIKTKEGQREYDTYIKIDNRLRRLTPRECFRLMGVCDTDIDTIKSTNISKSQQYKLAGNSIVVNVLYDIFKSLFIENKNTSTEKQLELF
jgi:DNA (cytosine-5)-methyltransferase 1